jgi:hypothetical protein
MHSARVSGPNILVRQQVRSGFMLLEDRDQWSRLYNFVLTLFPPFLLVLASLTIRLAVLVGVNGQTAQYLLDLSVFFTELTWVGR